MELEWNDADNGRSEADNALHVVFAEKEIIEQEKAQVMSLAISLCPRVLTSCSSSRPN